jgi:hypothetical protein
MKPECKLTRSDGNVFAIIATVCKSLKRAGMASTANEFRDKALSCESYGAVLRLCSDYVEVT